MNFTMPSLTSLERFFLEEFIELKTPLPLQLLFLHLFKAFKEGHLCIRIEENALFPKVCELWENNDLVDE